MANYAGLYNDIFKRNSKSVYAGFHSIREVTSGALSNIYTTTYGSSGNGYSLIELRSANGTEAFPSNVNNGDILGIVGGGGYGATGFSSDPRAYLSFKASGTWNDTSHPCTIEFFTTNISSITPVKAGDIDRVGAWSIGSSSGIGTSYHNVNGSIRLNVAATGRGAVGATLLTDITNNLYHDSTGAARATATATGYTQLRTIRPSASTDECFALHVNYQDAQTAGSALVATNNRKIISAKAIGSFTFGVSETLNYNAPFHTVNGGIQSGGSGTADQAQYIWIGANAYTANHGGASRVGGSTLGGAAMMLNGRTSNTSTAIQFLTNLILDTNTTPATEIGRSTQEGTWVFGPSTGGSLTHSFQSGTETALTINSRGATADSYINLLSNNTRVWSFGYNQSANLFSFNLGSGLFGSNQVLSISSTGKLFAPNGISEGSPTSIDNSGFFAMSANCFVTGFSAAQTRVDSTSGGAAVCVSNRTNNGNAAVQFWVNQTLDLVGAAADLAGQVHQAGYWTFGVTGNTTLHTFNGGLTSDGVIYADSFIFQAASTSAAAPGALSTYLRLTVNGVTYKVPLYTNT